METGVSKRQIIISLVNITIVLGALYLLFRYFGITEVQETIANAGIWAPLVLVLAKASTLVIAPLGGAPLYPLAGALFGFWKAVALLILGDMLGGVIAFYISRIFGRHVVEKLLGEDEKFLARALRMMGTVKGFFITRVCFTPLPEVTAYGAGLTRINFVPFVIVQTGVGVLPVVALAGLGSALTLGTWWMLPVAIVAGMVIIPFGFFVFRSVLKEWEETP
ncbi:MAG: VTT domain-containing protein [bacterium]|nr:VTT domain-containing protein [bacterium]